MLGLTDLAGALPIVGGLTSALTNKLGGDQAANSLKAANTKARTDLTQGYSQGMGFQQPIYDTAKNNYTDLSGKYASGGFSNPHMDPFKFDPQSVFQDPEYKAQMGAGTEAINRHAEATGGLFGGGQNRDLTQFGQDLFAKRSDALYNRGFDATNTAFNQNAASNATAFNQGNQLTQPLTGSANQLTDLSVNQGSDLAGNDQAAGNIRANNILGTTKAINGGISTLANNGSFLGKGQ